MGTFLQPTYIGVKSSIDTKYQQDIPKSSPNKAGYYFQGVLRGNLAGVLLPVGIPITFFQLRTLQVASQEKDEQKSETIEVRGWWKYMGKTEKHEKSMVFDLGWFFVVRWALTRKTWILCSLRIRLYVLRNGLTLQSYCGDGMFRPSNLRKFEKGMDP